MAAILKLHSLTRTNKRGCRSSVLIQRKAFPTVLSHTHIHTHTHSSSFLMPQITLAHYRSLKTCIKIMDVWRFKTHYIKTVYTCSSITVKWQKLVGYGQVRTGQDNPGERKWEPTEPARIDRQLHARRILPGAANIRATKTLLPTTQQALRISRTSTGWKIIHIKRGNINLVHPFRYSNLVLSTLRPGKVRRFGRATYLHLESVPSKRCRLFTTLHAVTSQKT
jgi:hypothetical protein